MKFRAWDKQQGKMLYDGFAIIPTSPTWSASILRYDEKVDALINDYWEEKGDILGGIYSTVDHTDWYGIEYLEVMRYTGLEDNNGKPIYEGDIVKWMEPGYDSLQPDKVRTSEVKWVQCGFAPFLWIEKNERFHDDHEAGDHLVDLTSDYHYYYAFEVIGNIYQNPELLNETTN